jgi:hypothetical protein
MFVSCQPLLQIKTLTEKKKKKSMNKAETVGLAGSLQAKQRVDGKSFSWLEFLVLSTSSHFGSS